MKIRKLAKKVLGRDVKSTTRDYWEKSANKNLNVVIKRICDGYSKEDFLTKTDAFLFEQKKTLNPEMVVLDLACGMGRTCRWIAPQVLKYVGVDFIPEMIQKAKEWNKEISNAEFHINDGKTLDIFESDTFDLIYCELAFQHMEKNIQQSYVPEIHRVLKKGGKFYAQLPKMEYYKDESFALTNSEIEKLFKNFKIACINDLPAYYVIEATKP